MKLESQVVSLELAKEMKELGFEQESLWSWVQWNMHKKHLPEKLVYEIAPTEDAPYFSDKREQCSAYTVAELGEMILNHCNEYAQGYVDCGCFYHFQYGRRGSGSMIEGIGKTFTASDEDNEADARAKMLIYLKKEIK